MPVQLERSQPTHEVEDQSASSGLDELLVERAGFSVRAALCRARRESAYRMVGQSYQNKGFEAGGADSLRLSLHYALPGALTLLRTITINGQHQSIDRSRHLAGEPIHRRSQAW